MNEYEVSVVIPIYNCEKYIRSCVKSILNQDYENLKKIQVILINDGSTDNSLEKCYEVQKEFDNLHIEIINSQNEGVSAARNKGIKSSKGKYIMFIDADDFISKNAIRKITKFFNEHYDEVDLVTYAMYEYDVITKNKKIIQRYKDCYTETRVYDLYKEYYAIQPTMNVVVKNQFKDNNYFDEKIYFHEDMLYITEILMKKLKIGYVKDAKYLYRIYGNNMTEYKENPLYSFEQYMYVFEKLFNQYETDNIPKYVQRIVLNVIRYRILKDKLFPYYLEGEKWDEAYSRLINIIKKIDNKIIMQYKQMDIYHKMYLIDLKEENQNIKIGYNSEYTINDDKKILLAGNGLSLIISRFKFKNKIVKLMGFIKSPITKYVKLQLYIKKITKDDEEILENITLHDTQANRYKTNIKVANFLGFECEFDVSDIKEFCFETKIEDKDINCSYYFNFWTVFNSSIQSYKIYSNNTRIQFKENKFVVSKPKKETQKKDFYRAVNRYSKVNQKINFYRILARIKQDSNEKIWLYYDRKSVFDNGYSQFKHDIKIKDDIKKYYILDGDKKKYHDKFDSKELKNVVRFGSLKHKILFLNSDKILTSFSSLQEYSPFYKTFQYYKDILKYDLIYLQHGILHANLVKMYSKMFAPIDKFVISSQFEKNNLISNYEYKEEDLISCGMPRLDDKPEEVKVENKIIFAPSWREYLIGKNIKRKRKINKKKFVDSKYYKETIKFLTNKKLLEKLKKENIILDYKLHPIFEPYIECFDDIINDNISVSIGNTQLGKYKAFITDFSSFQFDFVNLKRPITYFVPDMDEFKAGLHSYRELDLKYEDAFGKLCLTGDDLVNEVIKLIDNNFEMEPLYKERMENFFFKVDNRKDKLYEVLKNN